MKHNAVLKRNHAQMLRLSVLLVLTEASGPSTYSEQVGHNKRDEEDIRAALGTGFTDYKHVPPKPLDNAHPRRGYVKVVQATPAPTIAYYTLDPKQCSRNVRVAHFYVASAKVSPLSLLHKTRF